MKGLNLADEKLQPEAVNVDFTDQTGLGQSVSKDFVGRRQTTAAPPLLAGAESGSLAILTHLKRTRLFYSWNHQAGVLLTGAKAIHHTIYNSKSRENFHCHPTGDWTHRQTVVQMNTGPYQPGRNQAASGPAAPQSHGSKWSCCSISCSPGRNGVTLCPLPFPERPQLMFCCLWALRRFFAGHIALVTSSRCHCPHGSRRLRACPRPPSAPAATAAAPPPRREAGVSRRPPAPPSPTRAERRRWLLTAGSSACRGARCGW